MIGERAMETCAKGITRAKGFESREFEMIEAIMPDPFAGIGNPEPLKYLS